MSSELPVQLVAFEQNALGRVRQEHAGLSTKAVASPSVSNGVRKLSWPRPKQGYGYPGHVLVDELLEDVDLVHGHVDLLPFEDVLGGRLVPVPHWAIACVS